MFDFLAGPTGGLSYHAAALRYRHSLWTPFLGAVDHWLNEVWNPQNRELVIFGPSAGWTLPRKFLAKFDRIIGVEPDPLGRALFRYRFRSDFQNTAKPMVVGNLKFVSRADLLPWFSPKPQTFSDFLNSHADAAILFSNLLGQIAFLRPDRALADLSDKQELFIESLAGRNWASYHDLFSGPAAISAGAPKRLSGATAAALLTGLVPMNDFAEQIFPAGSHIVDHDTLWLSSPEGSAIRSTECAAWQIRPGIHHFVGFVHDSDYGNADEEQPRSPFA
jgi:hypothetical protein